MPGSPSPAAADKAGMADLAATGESHNAAFMKHISDYLEKNALTTKPDDAVAALKANTMAQTGGKSLIKDQSVKDMVGARAKKRYGGDGQ